MINVFDERYVSPYSADDSDDINERNNYWRDWEYAERLASATTCDFMHHCLECPLLCGNDEDEEIYPCEHSDELRGFIMVMSNEYPINQLYVTHWVWRNENLEWWYVKRW